jgi:hypothetical protein
MRIALDARFIFAYAARVTLRIAASGAHLPADFL